MSIKADSDMHVAARGGDAYRVSALLGKGEPVDDTRGDWKGFGRTPLHRAARHGHVEIVKMLLHAGADVNAGDLYKRRPLLYAAMAGHLKVAEELVKRMEPNAALYDVTVGALMRSQFCRPAEVLPPVAIFLPMIYPAGQSRL